MMNSHVKAQRMRLFVILMHMCTPKGNSIIQTYIYFNEIYYFKKGHDLILKC